MTRIEPRKAEDEWITQIHSPGYVAALNRHSPTSGRVASIRIRRCHRFLAAAYLAAGGALAGVDAIMQRQVEHVFCAVRPPGHHACLFNNVAIAARYLQKNMGSVASSSSTGMFITETAQRIVLSKILPFSSAPISIRIIRVPVGRPSTGPARAKASRSMCRWRREKATTNIVPRSC